MKHPGLLLLLSAGRDAQIDAASYALRCVRGIARGMSITVAHARGVSENAYSCGRALLNGEVLEMCLGLSREARQLLRPKIHEI